VIHRLTGALEEVGEGFAVVRCAGVSYQVLVPAASVEPLRSRLAREPEGEVTLHTLHYLEGGQAGSPLVPRLVGFLNPVARDFFVAFTTVKGIGPKRALRALALPIRDIASAIEEKDSRTLTRLPGIGARVAEQIVAELNGKMARFALMREPGEPEAPAKAPDLAAESVAVLLQLGYRKAEAEGMVADALQRRPDASGAEEVIAEVFRRTRG
jgi:Holliday junction DNA helicase RuvA